MRYHLLAWYVGAQASLAPSTRSSDASPFAGYLADPAEGWQTMADPAEVLWLDAPPTRLAPLQVSPRTDPGSVAADSSIEAAGASGRGSGSSGSGGGRGSGRGAVDRQASGVIGPPVEGPLGRPDDCFDVGEGAPCGSSAAM